MKTNRYLLGLALLVVGTMPAFSQVSNDNEDEVYKIDARIGRNDFVSGQVLVKFKDDSPMNVNKARGKFRSVDNSAVDAVLNEFNVEKMDKLLPDAKPLKSRKKSRAFNGEMVEEPDLSQLYLLETDETHAPQTMQLVDKLKKLDEVEYAEPNYKVYITDANIAASYGGNPYTTQQWYLDDYGVKQLWNKNIIHSKRPVIAIIDTGVDMTHPDLAPNLWTNTAEAEGEANYDNDNNGFAGDVHGWDFINNTPNIRDFNMHGTHVAGIAAAANNGIGIIGANPMALIMPVSVMQSDGTGDVATIVKGIDYAVKMGADVLNLSLGTYANSRALRQTLEKAYQTAVIVAAAGNDGRCINSPHHPIPCFGAAPMFPAAYSFVLGVQATTKTGALAGFSNYDDDGNTFSSVTTLQDPDGFNYELKAPGTEILSTIPGGKYKVLQGTSMAAPLVAGSISALLMVKDYLKDDNTLYQEILWGDLLHTNNIAEAYAVTNRPAELDLMKILYRERKDISELDEDNYSSDGEIDAGETVSLYPVIRTTFGAASNIQMKLEMGDEFEDPNTVEILTPGWVAFGQPLSAYAKSVSMNPMQVRVASNVADNRHIKMKFIAKCDETSTLYEGHFTMVVVNMKKISGLISENTTLTADHVYLVKENIGILEGATLTIEPGTRLEFEEGMGLSSFGKLVANGTPEKPIIFTGYHGAKWAGIKSHRSTGMHIYNEGKLYTNSDSTLFTLLPTEQTPNTIREFGKYIYYNIYEGSNPSKDFNLKDYVEGWEPSEEDYSNDMTSKQKCLTDPNFLTHSILQMFNDYQLYISQYSANYEKEGDEGVYVGIKFDPWCLFDNPRDTISYCHIDADTGDYQPYSKDCVFHECSPFNGLDGVRNTIHNFHTPLGSNIGNLSTNLRYSNIVNIYHGALMAEGLPSYSKLYYNNYFNNVALCNAGGKYYGKSYWLANRALTPNVDKSEHPSYLGTSREDIVRPYVYEIGNAPDTYGQIDLSNMRTTPIPEAHGIVWKVVVNGKDAQDEYEDLAPLGIGKHKFEVYFNRPMNKNVAPQISFGVRDPYTQNAVAEDGSWNAEGTIYTAYKTINGKTKSDGENRIYVWGAEDNEYFEIPYEKDRFNIRVNAAGSLATGFAGEGKMGRVELTWNNENNNFDDAMGFNIYRFSDSKLKMIPAHYDENNNWIEETQVPDTICINKEIVDIETTEYTDYDVIPGTTYYYMYKVLSTDLKEYDVSNVVAVTPLTSELGDANGSGDVDVADVITTVNYAAGMNPKPFIFEAADVNTDLAIDILDVVGIIQKVLNPTAGARAAARAAEETIAMYSIEDGVLYVESPVALAGVQVQLSLPSNYKLDGTLQVAEDLNGFEHTSAWLSDNDYLFMAYNMSGKTLTPGKHALLRIGDAEISSIRLANAVGHNVTAISNDGSETTGIDRMGKDVMTVKGVYSINGQKMAGSLEQMKKLPKGVYIIDGQKVVK